MIELLNPSIREVEKGLRNEMTPDNHHNLTIAEIAKRKREFANVMSAHREIGLQILNSNAIDAALQRQVILQESLREFTPVLLALDSFCAVFSDVPLEGTDKVEVPFFPLQTNASVTFDKTAGYTTARDWTENSREIVVGGDGDTATSGSNAAANTAKDRKYQALNFTSYQARRIPALNILELAKMAANKLAVDVFTDIVSRVINVANFGAGVAVGGAATFSADDVANLATAATGLNWPEMLRALTVGHDYYGSLLKDPSFKQYLSYGNADAIQRGKISNAYGFDSINKIPNFSSYSPAGENLVGWINHKSAVLVAICNVAPTEEVRLLMSRYDLIVDPATGVAFAYRRFGDTTLDKTTEVIEVSYGAEKGIASALKRMTSQ